MAESKQYLRLTFGGASWLLPNTAGYTIEQRENMTLNTVRDGRVSAWRTTRSNRWPAYALDDGFKVTRRDGWERAVFIEAAPHAIGVIVDEVQLLPRTQTQAAPFSPLGAPATRAGHLFAGAWVTEQQVMLVLEPRAFVVYLQGLGE